MQCNPLSHSVHSQLLYHLESIVSLSDCPTIIHVCVFIGCNVLFHTVVLESRTSLQLHQQLTYL